MRRAISSVIALLGGIILAAPAFAEVSIVVDKSIQRITVSVNGAAALFLARIGEEDRVRHGCVVPFP
jgi:hypothetical protein